MTASSASSASNGVVADSEQEQTSAPTVLLVGTIVWHVTVRILAYYDNLVVIFCRQHFSVDGYLALSTGLQHTRGGCGAAVFQHYPQPPSALADLTHFGRGYAIK